MLNPRVRTETCLHSSSKSGSGQAQVIKNTSEGQFGDVKALEISPSKLTKTISAFANSDGGDLYIRIDEDDTKVSGHSAVFPMSRATLWPHQAFESLFPLGRDFQYEFYLATRCRGWCYTFRFKDRRPLLRPQTGFRTYDVAQSLPVDSAEKSRGWSTPKAFRHSVEPTKHSKILS